MRRHLLPDTGATNITWIYASAATITNPPGSGTTKALGTASYVSHLGAKMVGQFTSQDHVYGTSLVGLRQSFTQTPIVPVSGAHTALIGMLGTGLFWLRSRKRQPA